MSADRREPMGLQHMTVVPENFEPAADHADDGSGDDDPEDAA